MSGDRTPKVFVSSKQSELNGTFSPDGRWVAYQSNASGRYEIVVRPFPNKDPARTISRDGGRYPRWRGDGKELFFVSPDGTMMAAGFDATNGVSQGVPQPLFPTQIRVGDNRPYAVDKNGQRFLLKVASRSATRRRHGLADVARPVNCADKNQDRSLSPLRDACVSVVSDPSDIRKVKSSDPIRTSLPSAIGVER